MKHSHNITKTMSQIYGTGNFNPRAFERKKRPNASRWYLWGAGLLLLAIAVIIAAGLFLFADTGGTFTGDRVSVALKGSSRPMIASAQSYVLTIQNNEDVSLDNMELFIDWEFGVAEETEARAAYVLSEKAPASDANNTWQLGSIGAGETQTFTIDIRFNGREGQHVVLPMTLSFTPEGFSSTFVARQSAEFDLGADAIALAIKGPDTVSDGAEVALAIEISGDTTLFEQRDSLELLFEYPDSFSVIAEDPARAPDAQGWKLADLPKEGDAYQVLIRGTIADKNGGDQHLSARLMQQPNLEPLAETEKVILVQSADVGIIINVQPASGKKLQWGETVTYTVTVENTGTYVMRNTVVSLQLSGEGLWQTDSLVISQSGAFEAGAIMWDSAGYAPLDSIRPGSSVALSFSAKTKSSPPKGFDGTPALLARASSAASLGDQEVRVESGEVVTKILSTVSIDAFGWYRSPEGITYGSGPHPPLAGQETKYAIVLTLGPTSSALEQLEITATLGNGVSWVGNEHYTVGELSYAAAGRTVTWKAVRVPQLELPVTIRFMVGITPAAQLPVAAPLLEKVQFKATDAPTGELMEFFLNPVTVGSIQ